MNFNLRSVSTRLRGIVPDVAAATLSVTGMTASALWGGLVEQASAGAGLPVSFRALASVLIILATVAWFSKRISGRSRPMRPRRSMEGFTMLKGEMPPGGFDVSLRGNILCGSCRRPMRLSACHAQMDALVGCDQCSVIAVADRPVSRLRADAARLASASSQGAPAGRGYATKVVPQSLGLTPCDPVFWLWN
jgi:hypothetical protein